MREASRTWRQTQCLFYKLAKVIATTFQLMVEQGKFERRTRHSTRGWFEERELNGFTLGTSRGVGGARLSNGSSR